MSMTSRATAEIIQVYYTLVLNYDGCCIAEHSWWVVVWCHAWFSIDVPANCSRSN